MRTKAAYLVIDIDRSTIVRSTQRWPQMDGGEFAVRIRLEIPDELIPNVVYEIEIDDPEAIGVSGSSVVANPPEENE